MEKYKLILILTLINVFRSSGQEGTESNLWLSGQIIKSKGLNVHSIDASFRTQDYFIKSPRQVVFRYIYNRKIGERFSLGTSIGYFDHYTLKSKEWTSEIRPFFQAQFKKPIKSGELKFRLRNELRYYPKSEELLNRIRFQINYTIPISKAWGLIISEEGFCTPQLTKSIENRSFIGIQYSLKNNNMIAIQYLIHWQQSQNGIVQNIINLSWTKELKK